MTFKTSLTGSFPPIYDPFLSIRTLPPDEQDQLVHRSIERAIDDQIRLGVDILVDGQVRDDIVSLFCSHTPGFAGDRLPYRVIAPLRTVEAGITVADFRYARALAPDSPFKAHLTGPLTLASNLVVEPESGYSGRNDPRLIADLTALLAHEARLLVAAGADIIQFDEPALSGGGSLDTALAAMQQIVDTAEIPVTGLHICGNVARILREVLRRAPVQFISTEGSWLKRDELADLNEHELRASGKQIGLGCISVTDYTVERLTSVQTFVDEFAMWLGPENIWALMPNCGFRLMPYEAVIGKIEIMVRTAQTLEF